MSPFPILPLIAALAGSLSLLSLSLGLYRMVKPAGELEDRLEHTVNRVPVEQHMPLMRRGQSLLTHINLDRKLSQRMALDLAQADLAITVNEFVLIRLGAMLVGLLVGGLAFGQPLLGVGLAVVGMQAPVFVVHQRFSQRQARFQHQLVDVITMLSSGLRAGVGLMQAMELVKREMPDPAAQEFGRVVREVGLGVGLEGALQHLLERMPGDDLGMLVTIIKIQAEVGGNLVAIMETVVNTIRERVRIAQEIKTLTAQQRMTGYLLGGLPFIVGTALMLINPQYMGTLFEPRWIWLPGMALVMMAVGFVVIGKLVDIKV